MGLGREPKWEAARAEEPQSRVLGGGAGWPRPAQHALPAGLGSQLAGAYVQACRADQPPVPLPSPSKRTPEPHQVPAPPQQAGALSPLPKTSIPSRLTSVIFSSIHLVIHVHGKFLKKPVAELEAEMGTQALSDQLAPQCQASQLTRILEDVENDLCVPCAAQPSPQSQNWQLG